MFLFSAAVKPHVAALATVVTDNPSDPTCVHMLQPQLQQSLLLQAILPSLATTGNTHVVNVVVTMILLMMVAVIAKGLQRCVRAAKQ